MTDLLAKLESAGEGSRELSDECLLAVGWVLRDDGRSLACWHGPNGQEFYPCDFVPDPSRNVQDAIDWMVPESLSYSLGAPDWSCTGKNDESSSAAWANIFKGRDGEWNTANAANPALALCIASLRAREAEI